MSAMTGGAKMWIALAALAVSTVLNALYYFKALIIIFSKQPGETVVKCKSSTSCCIGLTVFIIANILLGLFYQPVMEIIAVGMDLL